MSELDVIDQETGEILEQLPDERDREDVPDEIIDVEPPATISDTAAMIIEDATAEIRRLIRRSSEDILEIGRNLVRVRDLLPKGQFQDWVTSEFSWSLRTAYNFIAVHERLGGFIERGQLASVSNAALYMLAGGSVPDEVVASITQRVENGERIGPKDVAGALEDHRRAARTDDATLYTCTACGQTFAATVWHCETCNNHWEPGVHPCPECASDKPAPVPTVIDLVTVPSKPDVFAPPPLNISVSSGSTASDPATPTQSKDEKCARMITNMAWVTALSPSDVVAHMDDIQRENMDQLVDWFVKLGQVL